MPMNSQVGVNGGGSSGAGVLKRGTKRGASDSSRKNQASDLERFEKRLRMLSLQNGDDKSNLYTPVSNVPPERSSDGLSHANHVRSPQQNELMQVDDTRDRVYIHDLDKELEEIESDDGKERLVFLPDIEKHFSKLPQQVLAGGQDGSRELVLYSVPKSLSVDEGHDSVRKAIIESRYRAREKAAEEARHAAINREYDHNDHMGSMETSHGYLPASVEEQPEHDPDAMDIGHTSTSEYLLPSRPDILSTPIDPYDSMDMLRSGFPFGVPSAMRGQNSTDVEVLDFAGPKTEVQGSAVQESSKCRQERPKHQQEWREPTPCGGNRPSKSG